MDLVRSVCSTALGLRKAHQLRVRLPLASLTIAHPAAGSLAPFAGLIAEEVNVKAVELSAEPASLGRFELAVNPRVLGPRLGGQVQQVIRAVKAGVVDPGRRPGRGGRRPCWSPASTSSSWPRPTRTRRRRCPATPG